MVLCGRRSGVGGRFRTASWRTGWTSFDRRSVRGTPCSAVMFGGYGVRVADDHRHVRSHRRVRHSRCRGDGCRDASRRLPTLVVWTVLVALQIVAVVSATDPRSAVVLRMVAPAGLTAVTVAAVWTALALAVPPIATGNAVALVAIVAAGLVVVASSRRGAGQRLLPLVLIPGRQRAADLPCDLVGAADNPRLCQSHHPPTYTDVTRLVDPIGEFAIFVVLALALGVEVLRARCRTRRTTAREQRPAYLAARTRWSSSPTSRHSRRTGHGGLCGLPVAHPCRCRTRARAGHGGHPMPPVAEICRRSSHRCEWLSSLSQEVARCGRAGIDMRRPTDAILRTGGLAQESS